MKSNLLTIFIFILTFISFSGLSQEIQNTLLLKIEGNGLLKPSYLYGTMHVKDKRVFNFSDSVFLAIDNCDAFALEIHPDSVILEIIKSVQENFDNSYYEELLTDEEFDRFKEKFKKINGYELGAFQDVVFAESQNRKTA